FCEFRIKGDGETSARREEPLDFLELLFVEPGPIESAGGEVKIDGIFAKRELVAGGEIAADSQAGHCLQALAESHRSEGVGTEGGILRIDVSCLEPHLEDLEETEDESRGEADKAEKWKTLSHAGCSWEPDLICSTL